MKKISLVIVLLLVTILLTGCITRESSFQAYEEIEQISSVQVYYFDASCYPKELDDSTQPIKIIEQDSYSELINDLE